MNFIAIGNIILVTAFCCVLLSYFWSHWTFKLFKPHLWLDLHKKKLIHKQVESIEHHCKDKNQFYNIWFLLNHIETKNVDGSIVVVGIENVDIPKTCAFSLPERKVILIDDFENKDLVLTKENCNGEISTQEIHLAKPSVDLLNFKNAEIKKGEIEEEVTSLSEPISLAIIDIVDYDCLLHTLQHVYKLLSPSGAIVVHDYNHNWHTVKEAVDLFQATLPENFLPIPDMYGSVVLIKNK